MTRILYFLFCFLLMANSVYSRICINEVMQSNINGIMDDYNEFPDSWVELYNDDSVTFDFTEYSISPTKDFADSYPLMDSTIIPAKGYLLIYCDKEDYGGRHANFRLDSDGQTLYVFDPVGHIVDSLVIPEMLAPNISYGRISDGADSLSWFKIATPTSSNTGFYTDKILKKPKFSVKGGLYSNPVSLHLSLQGECPADAVIRYTTNGSEPTDSSPIAPDTIFIDHSIVIRAKTFSDSALSKLSKTESYLFLGRQPKIPVFSIVMDSSYLWDDEIGIYTVGTYGITHPDAISENPDIGSMNYLFKWRRPMSVEYFEVGDSASSINQDGEICVSGGSSKDGFFKSFSLFANKRFGEKTFSYPFWHESKPQVSKCKSFMLRTSGQALGGSYMNDGLAQISMGRYVNLDYQEYKPCAIVVNGEYWGVINLRERSNHNYIWQNYNKLENIDLIQGEGGFAETGDLEDYYSFRSLYNSSTSSFSSFDSIMDVSEFCDYFILNYILCNTDFPGNINYTLWKEKKIGAKWRWIAKDMDLAWGLAGLNPYSFNYLNFILRVSPFEQRGQNQEQACTLFKKMMSFDNFKNTFIDRASVYMGTFMRSNILDSMIDSTKNMMAEEYAHFCEAKMPSKVEYWSVWINNMKTWIDERIPYVYDNQHDFFNLGDTVSVNIKSCKSKPLFFNGVKVENNRFDGKFYYGRPIYLSHSDSSFAYRGDSIYIEAADSVKNAAEGYWYVLYEQDGNSIVRRFRGKSLFYAIPKSATNVFITDSFSVSVPLCDSLPIVTKRLADLGCGMPSASLNISADRGSDSFGNSLYARKVSFPDSCFIGTNILPWTYVDIFGDTTICNQQVEIQGADSIAFEECNSLDTLRFILLDGQSFIDSSAILSYRPTALGYCGLKYYGELNSKNEYKVGTDSLSWTFTNEYGRTLTCPQTVEVIDTIKPVLDICDSLPLLSFELKELSCGLLLDTLPIPVLTANDNLDSVIVGTLIAPDTVSIGLNDVIWKFVDASNNELLCKQQLEVIDKCAPVCFDCGDVSDTVYYNLQENTCGFLTDSIKRHPIVAYDNCGIEILGTLLDDDSILPIGVNTIHWTFTDDAGNVSNYSQTIVVKDDLPPVINCDTLQLIISYIDKNSSIAQFGELKLMNPVAFDNCNTPIYGALSQIDTISSGLVIANWLFEDACGNQKSCPQILWFVNMLSPTYESCDSMPDILVNLTDNSSSLPMNTVNFAVPVAKETNSYVVNRIDNIDSSTVLSMTALESEVSGTLYAADSAYLGDNTLTWVFFGSSGIPQVCSQIVKVSDLFPPFFDCNSLDEITVDLYRNNCGMEIDSIPFVTPYAIDNSGSLIQGNLVNAPDNLAIGDNEVWWRFEDASGNIALCPQSVSVVDKFPPVIDCASLDTIKVELALNANDIMKDKVPFQIPHAIDNCEYRITGNLYSDDALSVGNNNVLWSFEDLYGNVSFCPQTVTVIKHFKVSLFPNPTTGYLYVAGVDAGDRLLLTNSIGEVIFDWAATGNPTLLDLSDLADGVYILRVKDDFYKVIKD